MLANFFGKSNPVNFIVIFSIFLGVFFTNSISSIPLVSLNFSLVLEHVLTLFLFLIFFFFYNFILSKNKFIEDLDNSSSTWTTPLATSSSQSLGANK